MVGRGLFLSLEGGENSGKTTQAALLAGHLQSRGVDVVQVREPGGTPVGESLRRILLDPHHEDMTPETEVLLYAAARSQLAHRVIAPALHSGRTVISDRYLDSSLAYQGYGLGLDVSRISNINAWGTGGLLPDLTILFVERVLRSSPPGDRIESRPPAYHSRVVSGYLELARKEPERFLVIMGPMSVQDVHACVVSRVDALLVAQGIGGQA